MKRLDETTMGGLPAAVARVGYDRTALAPGIVHLGVGAFHRAHMAVMTDEAIAAGDIGWGILTASLRSPETRDALRPQAWLYTVATQAPEVERLRVVGSIADVLVAPEDPERLVAAMADPRVRIVSLTVTEKGYCRDPATGALDEAHPDIVHDLARPRQPRSAPGFLVAALAERRAAGVPPFTVLSCDNLPANGRATHGVIARLATLIDPALGAFIHHHVACPSSMVDRIVPATTDADRARVSAALGVEDAWPVMAEPFSQWVIEDRFPLGRPRWELAGAQFVGDVEPFELMKLRLLNGAHSTLAYLGLLAGYETVANASADPALARAVEALWDEVRPTVPPPEGTDLRVYCHGLLDRFRNPAIRHRLAQIAMDGSQKLPQRILAPIRDNLASGRSIGNAALAIAAFALHASGVDAKGGRVDVRDPLAGEMATRLENIWREPVAALDRLLALKPLFGTDLPDSPAFRMAVRERLESLVVNR